MHLFRLIIASILCLAALPAILAQAEKDQQDSISSRYLAKAPFLKVPVSTDPCRVFVASGSYRILPEKNRVAGFGVGRQVRITSIDFGTKELKLKMESLDRKNSAEIRIQFALPIDGNSQEAANILARFFTLTPGTGEIDAAKRDYIENQYDGFVAAESQSAEISEQVVHDVVVKATPIGKSMLQDLQNLAAKTQEQAATIAALEKERNSLNGKLNSLQQDKLLLDSTGKDYRERIKSLQATESEAKKQLARKTQDFDNLVRSIRAALTEMGLQAGSAAPTDELLKVLSQSYLQISAGNRAYQSRVEQLQGDLAKKQTEMEGLSTTLEQARKEREEMGTQFEILANKDKDLARRMLQLQHEKNIIQSKLLSHSLLKVMVERKRTDRAATYTARLKLKGFDLGSLILTTPPQITPGQGVKITMESHLTTAEELAKIRDPEVVLLIKYLEQFPKLDVLVEKRNPFFELKELQSPDRDNTDLWVWQATPAAHQDVDLVFRYMSRIEAEPIPLFDISLSIPYPSMEKTLVEYFQPVPLGVGIVVGLLLALPFFIIHRRRDSSALSRQPRERRKSLHFDKKEL